jgi:molecular chaperone DnaK (HSP70)
VPAKFTSEQKAATAAAFKKAGLKVRDMGLCSLGFKICGYKVIRVMEEPTAAAVAYDLHKKKNVHQILVYDFGGGTLDVSLLYVAKESVQVALLVALINCY